MSTSFQTTRPIVVDSELPAQTAATNGKALISNGMTANWTTILGMIGTNAGQVPPTQFLNAVLPSQTGNGGKALVTDGSNATWVGPVATTAYVQSAGQNSQGSKTVSTSTPIGTGTPGDIWYVV